MKKNGSNSTYLHIIVHDGACSTFSEQHLTVVAYTAYILRQYYTINTIVFKSKSWTCSAKFNLTVVYFDHLPGSPTHANISHLVLCSKSANKCCNKLVCNKLFKHNKFVTNCSNNLYQACWYYQICCKVVPTSPKESCPKLLVPSCKQVWNKLFKQLVTSLLILSDLLQGCSNKSDQLS